MTRFHPMALLARALGWMISVAALTLVLASGLGMRLDNAFYDLHMRHWSYQPGNAVAIVAIDPKSLSALGNWPWPRATHARLLDRLSAAGVRAVGMDITMAEPDLRHPENDTALAAAFFNGDEAALEDRREELRATLPVRRVIAPADLAAMAVHVMTNTAVTGATFDVDGGQRLID